MRNEVLYLILFSLLLLSCSDKQEQKTGKEQKNAPMAVDVVILTPKKLERSLQTTGSLLPNEEVELKAQVSGKIMNIGFKEGRMVEKGQMLVQIDDRARKAQLNRYEAELELAKKNLSRKEELLKVSGVSQEEVDQAANQVATLKANIQEIEAYIDNARIEAPFSGIIGLRRVSPGDMLQQGTSVAQLVQRDPVKLDFTLPEKHSGQIKPGQQVNFTVTGKKDTFRARVSAMEPMIDPSTRSLKVRAVADNEHGHLMPGAFADITLSLGQSDSALMVPSEAIERELNEQMVWLIKKGKAQKVEVETGMNLERSIQLTAGVSVNDTVMITGLLQAQQGMPVTVRNVEKVSVQ